MKALRVSVILAVTLILAAGPGLSKATAAETVEVSATEKAAIEAFKKEVETTIQWIEEKQKAPQTDPMAGIAAMGEMIGKFKAIKTDGLPEDLKGAWGEMNGVFGELGDVFKGLPVGQPGNQEEAMKAFGEIFPKLIAIQGKIEPIAKKLEEVGKKYGMDLSKLGGK